MPVSIAAQTLDLVHQVLEAQQETNRQLAIQNGRTRHLEEREEAHSKHLGNLDEQVTQLREKVAAAGVKDEVHDKELGWTRERIVKLIERVALVGGILAILAKDYAPQVVELLK